MKLHVSVVLLLAVLAGSLIAASPAAPYAPVVGPSTMLPPGVRFTPVITGLTQPVFVTHAGDSRLFVVQQTGQIRIFKSGSLLAANFLDVSGVAGFTNAGGEQGLLGLAFDPNYAANRYFYITYTITTSNTTYPYAVRLVRYQTSSGNPDVADPGSAFIILTTPKKYTNHNGGMIAFGPDGFLYWGTGDGGSGGDPDNNAQNLKSLLGKILRLDVHAPPPARYAIPPSNPFAGSATARQEIWAYGVRNPWRWSFDRATGDLYIGDVGQNRQEEIDFQAASSAGGQNYGWHILEGNLCYLPLTGCTKPANYVAPVAVYNHGTNDSIGCAVTGGYVYRGSASPLLQGVYFYGDYCSGNLWALVRNSGKWSNKLIASTNYHISSFGQDQAGELYLVDRGGQVLRISQIATSAAAFVSEAAYDGTIIETGETSNKGGAPDASRLAVLVGDTATRRQIRAILSFNTAGLPDKAVVTSAALRIKLRAVTPTSPFGVLGRLVADMAVPRFGSAVALEAGDFQAAATALNAATFGSTASAGWYSAGVVKAYLPSISRTARTQFRLRFTLDDNNDSVANYAGFFSGNATNAADRPRLVIQYYVP